MLQDTVLLFDFDSTFTQVEALDELGDLVLNGPDKKEKLHQIASITDKGMAGEVSFRQSLEMRMDILSGTRNDLDNLVEVLKSKVSKSIEENKGFFIEHSSAIYIVSSGFKDFIVPVVADYGIEASHVFANTFSWNSNTITGFDSSNPLSGDKGKPTVVSRLGLNGKVVAIGDGYTDYEIKEAGAADLFIAFAENVKRPSVLEKADFIANNFDDFLNFITNGTETILPQA